MPKARLSQFLQRRVNFCIFSFLPWRLSLLYIFILGWLYYNLLNRKERKDIKRNLDMVFDNILSYREMKSLTRKTISNTIIHYAEKLFQVCYSYQKAAQYIRKRVKFIGLEVLDRALSEGKGVLIVTGHFGAMEFLPGSLALRGYPLSILAKFKTEKLRSISMERAAKAGFSILDCENHPNPLKTSIKCLQKGKVLVAECDEIDSWRPFNDRQASFLGQTVAVDKTIDLLAKKSGCKVITAFLRRDKKDTYSLVINEMEHPVNGESTGELLLKTLENYIYSYPEQWYHWMKFDAMIADEVAPICESPAQPSLVLESLYAFK